jgi:hypothetical protein
MGAIAVFFSVKGSYEELESVHGWLLKTKQDQEIEIIFKKGTLPGQTTLSCVPLV